MSVDHGADASASAPLPGVREVPIRRRRFEPPRPVTSEGVDRTVDDAVAIELVGSEPFAIRVFGPVQRVRDEAFAVEVDAP